MKSWGRFFSRKRKLIWLSLFGLVLVAIPMTSRMYLIRVATDVLLYAAIAQCWNMIGGLAGYPSFGVAGFFGAGAYTMAVLVTVMNWPAPFAILVGGVGSAVISAILWPVLRLKTHYFAIATFAAAETLREIVTNLEITRGGKGMSLPIFFPDIETAAITSYIAVVVVFLTAMLICYTWLKSKVGGALLAIREDEYTAESIGIDTRYYKCLAFSTSAFLTGVAGGVYAYWIGYIDPHTAFNVMISVESIVMVMLGGAGTLWGPTIGAIVLGVARELLWGQYPELHGTLVGILIVVLTIFVPSGLSKIFRGGQRATLRSFLRNAQRYGV